MNRRAAVTVLVGSIFALLLIVVSTAGEVEIAQRAPTIPWNLTPNAEPLPPPPPIESEFPAEQIDDEDGRELPPIVDSILEALFIGLGIAILAYGLAVLWRNRPQVRWKRREEHAEFDLLAETAAALTADADAQFAALRSGSPRNAIVECWLRLESAVASAGFEADPSDTTAEFTSRVLSQFSVDAAAVDLLSALYREARFSTHELGESTRQRAIRSLASIHQSLRPYHEAPADEPHPAAP